MTEFNCTFPNPHFNAFIDLDGDCLADLFFTCKKGDSDLDLSYQIWLNDKSGGFKLARTGDLPKGTKSVGFADMGSFFSLSAIALLSNRLDRDGTIDMVITACPTAAKCSLNIAYNSQVPLCSTSPRSASGPCRDPEALCVADSNFSFNLNFEPNNHDFTSILISSLVPKNNLVTSTSTSASFRGTLPVSPQIGDFNIDGYPDLLLLTSPTSSTGFRSITLLESKPCDRASCTAGEVSKGRRAFKVVTKGAEVLIGMDDVESAHWIDLDDDGSLDILVQRVSSRGGAARRINFVKNNYFHDAFFLKALSELI